MGFEINSHFDFIKLNVLMGAFVFAGMYIFNGPVEHDPVSVIPNGQNVARVQAGSYVSHYTLGQKIDESFLVTAIYPQRRRTNPFEDFHSQFVTFSRSSAQQYIDQYAGMTHCPAQFLNQHADHISLYAASPAISKKLAHWKQKRGSSVARWEVVNITGQCMEERTRIEKDGEDVTDSTQLITIGRKASRDCHMIYVTDVQPTKSSIEDYVEG